MGVFGIFRTLSVPEDAGFGASRARRGRGSWRGRGWEFPALSELLVYRKMQGWGHRGPAGELERRDGTSVFARGSPLLMGSNETNHFRHFCRRGLCCPDGIIPFVYLVVDSQVQSARGT